MKITEVPERCPVCNGELTWKGSWGSGNSVYFDCKSNPNGPYQCFYGKKSLVVYMRLENGMGIKFCFNDKKTYIWTNGAPLGSSPILDLPFADPSLEYSEVNSSYAERLLKLKAFI
jgi:hypothetical protein